MLNKSPNEILHEFHNLLVQEIPLRKKQNKRKKNEVNNSELDVLKENILMYIVTMVDAQEINYKTHGFALKRRAEISFLILLNDEILAIS